MFDPAAAPWIAAGLLNENSPAPAAPPLRIGDPAPWLVLPSDLGAGFPLASLGGRRIALVFVGSLQWPSALGVVDGLLARAKQRLDPFRQGFVVVTSDRNDFAAKIPGDQVAARYLFDFDGKLASLFGVIAGEALQPTTFILDPHLRVERILPVVRPGTHAVEVIDALAIVPALAASAPAAEQAPVLMLRNIFEPELCKALVAGYEGHGGEDSLFMVERNGRTVYERNHQKKRRSDWVIDNPDLQEQCRSSVVRRIVPEIHKAYQFRATRIERYLVGRYGIGDHFEGMSRSMLK